MLKKLRNREAGFTIVEVLIVLAIAGLILLIIFLAVPALQRNSRNNSIRSDASNVLAGVNDSIAVNNGQMPSGCTFDVNNGEVTIAGGSDVEAQVRGGTDGSCVDGVPGAPGATGIINVGFNAGCDGNTPVAKNRAISAFFLVETTGGGGTAEQCLEG